MDRMFVLMSDVFLIFPMIDKQIRIYVSIAVGIGIIHSKHNRSFLSFHNSGQTVTGGLRDNGGMA